LPEGGPAGVGVKCGGEIENQRLPETGLRRWGTRVSVPGEGGEDGNAFGSSPPASGRRGFGGDGFGGVNKGGC